MKCNTRFVIFLGSAFFLGWAAGAFAMAQARRKRGRPKAPPLYLLPEFHAALLGVERQGVGRRQIVRAIEVCSPRTVECILAGAGRRTPLSLAAIALVAELPLGGVRRDRIVRGVVLDPPATEITIRFLRRLAAGSLQARSFVVRRLVELEDLHFASGFVDLLPATQEAQP
jgi:hypothetical protein